VLPGPGQVLDLETPLRARCRDGFTLARSTDRVLAASFLALLSRALADAVAQLGPQRAAQIIEEEAEAWRQKHGCPWCGAAVSCLPPLVVETGW